ncbi:MucBP domain-containing protein [Loigolactobacillus iwatensis]|uniref:MucBP domain-containing protein n=1 Tax=Loigolactobacillus iwatensis TaxID=1267156 RepID=UPI0013DDBBC0|nr:MucBP domain-containing protein [Loigolactobacillus iwatensis]
MEDANSKGLGKVQNRIVIRYVDRDGNALNEDLSLFGEVGSRYEVNAPAFSGYLLVDKSRPTVGKMPAEAKPMIILTYARLGSVRIFNTISDLQGKVYALTTINEQPDKVQPLHLPEVAGKDYYLSVDKESSIRKIFKPQDFVPDDPTQETVLLILSITEARKLKETQATESDSEMGTEAVTQPASAESTVVVTTPASKPESIPAKIPVVKSTKAEETLPVTKTSVAPVTAKASLQLATILLQQAALLDNNADQIVLDEQQLQRLTTNMRHFMLAIKILNQ